MVPYSRKLMRGLIFYIAVVIVLFTSIKSTPIPENDESSSKQTVKRISPSDEKAPELERHDKEMTSQTNKPIKTPVSYMHGNTVDSSDDTSFVSQFPRASLRIVGSAAAHFRFWKTVHKVALPQVKFLQQAMENLLSSFCSENTDDIPGDCMEFSFNLVSHWNSEDFIRSPRHDVMRIRSQKRFGKGLITDVIKVLNFHKRNLTDLLNIEELHHCEDKDSPASCDVTCSFGNSPYCIVKDVILPNLSTLILKLTKQAKQYYGIDVPLTEEQQLSSEKQKFFAEYRKFYIMAVLYNTMDQMYETEAALEYLVELSDIQRLSVNYRTRV